jgi:predicted RecA/RadA family phage recombinase
MKNFVCKGEKIPVLVAGADVVSGAIYLLGSKVCVVENGAVIGEIATLVNEGVFTLAKATGAVTIGQKLYYDATNLNITTVAAANTLAGYAFEAAASGDTTVNIVLTDNTQQAQSTVIAALGTTTNLTAIAASYADLAAARTSVNTLAGEVEARLDAIDAKIDATLAALKAAGLMATA